MAIRPSHIKDKTGRETNTHAARHARLERLADSVNDTARMARNSLSLLLMVALYLGLTLVASTDENLLLNGQVVLPQVGVGLSVVQSYIFAPLIFIYLHAQLLFQLTVLARKVRTFEVALKEEFPDTVAPNMQEKVEAKREECRDWLSAFAFVQLFRLPSGVPHTSKVLAWFGIEAVPVVLLFVLDLSFVRYQSDWITWEHHIICIIDLVFLTWFNYRVFSGWFWARWKRPIESFGKSFSSRSLLKNVTIILAYIGSLARGALAVGMVLLLVFAAHPPSFDPKTAASIRRTFAAPPLKFPVDGGRSIAIREDQKSVRRTIEGFWRAVWWWDENPIDAGPCEWWGLACRYLNVSNKRPSKTQTQDMSGPKSDSPSDKGFANSDLAERNLRFAKFPYAHLRDADLGRAQLQGASLWEAQLQGAHLGGAQLQGAHLWEAQLQGADLLGAQLQGADLGEAELQGAHLGEAQLQGAHLREAQLQGADLGRAELQGAHLGGAQLQGADLGNAWLQCTDLEGARLQGTDLGNAQLQGSSGNPDPEHLIWAPGVSYDFPADKSSYLETLVSGPDPYRFGRFTETIKIAWRRRRREMPLEEHLRKCIEEDRQPIDPLPDNSRQPDWNTWAEWTAEFACEDEYTARSSLKRWTSFSPLSGLEDSDRAEAQKLVREALETTRKIETEEECPGLHSISDDEWKKFVDGWP